MLLLLRVAVLLAAAEPHPTNLESSGFTCRGVCARVESGRLVGVRRAQGGSPREPRSRPKSSSVRATVAAHRQDERPIGNAHGTRNCTHSIDHVCAHTPCRLLAQARSIGSAVAEACAPSPLSRSRMNRCTNQTQPTQRPSSFSDAHAHTPTPTGVRPANPKPPCSPPPPTPRPIKPTQPTPARGAMDGGLGLPALPGLPARVHAHPPPPSLPPLRPPRVRLVLAAPDPCGHRRRAAGARMRWCVCASYGCN